MSILTSAFDWIVKSSANPQQLAMTVKGMLAFLVFLGLDTTDVAAAESSVGVFILGLGYILSASMTLYGFGRKVYLTWLK